MSENTGSLHFFMALVAGLLVGLGAATTRYVVEKAYGITLPPNGFWSMTMTALTVCFPLAIIVWREDFDYALKARGSLFNRPVFAVWLAAFAIWIGVVIFVSVHAQAVRGEAWYQHFPGALVLYAVPTLAWLVLTRTFLRLRIQMRQSDVTPA